MVNNIVSDTKLYLYYLVQVNWTQEFCKKQCEILSIKVLFELSLSFSLVIHPVRFDFVDESRWSISLYRVA